MSCAAAVVAAEKTLRQARVHAALAWSRQAAEDVLLARRDVAGGLGEAVAAQGALDQHNQGIPPLLQVTERASQLLRRPPARPDGHATTTTRLPHRRLRHSLLGDFGDFGDFRG